MTTANELAGRLQRDRQRRATGAAHVASMTGKVFKVWGLVDIVGTGEALLDVSFPVLFTELPSIGGSTFHLADGEVVEAGKFPDVKIGVKQWVFDQKLGTTRWYRGAQLSIVVAGHDGICITAHYQFEGRAIVPPVFTETLAEDVV